METIIIELCWTKRPLNIGTCRQSPDNSLASGVNGQRFHPRGEVRGYLCQVFIFHVTVIVYGPISNFRLGPDVVLANALYLFCSLHYLPACNQSLLKHDRSLLLGLQTGYKQKPECLWYQKSPPLPPDSASTCRYLIAEITPLHRTLSGFRFQTVQSAGRNPAKWYKLTATLSHPRARTPAQCFA